MHSTQIMADIPLPLEEPLQTERWAQGWCSSWGCTRCPEHPCCTEVTKPTSPRRASRTSSREPWGAAQCCHCAWARPHSTAAPCCLIALSTSALSQECPADPTAPAVCVSCRKLGNKFLLFFLLVIRNVGRTHCLTGKEATKDVSYAITAA